jgi:hypothetical protein
MRLYPVPLSVAVGKIASASLGILLSALEEVAIR